MYDEMTTGATKMSITLKHKVLLSHKIAIWGAKRNQF